MAHEFMNMIIYVLYIAMNMDIYVSNDLDIINMSQDTNI